MIGIYKITNLINNKCYIGKSVDIKRRWIRHRYNATSNAKTTEDSCLIRAFKKYGIDNFKFEVLEECMSNELNVKEKYYIQLYQSYNGEYGYNMTLGGDGSLKQDRDRVLRLWESGLSLKQIAEEIYGSRNTVKDILREYNIPFEQEVKDRWKKRVSRRIEQRDFKGNVICIWPSFHEIERVMGFDRGSISDCCNYVIRQSHGYRWRYADRSEVAMLADLLD